jgi:hypothetical protein
MMLQHMAPMYHVPPLHRSQLARKNAQNSEPLVHISRICITVDRYADARIAGAAERSHSEIKNARPFDLHLLARNFGGEPIYRTSKRWAYMLG